MVAVLEYPVQMPARRDDSERQFHPLGEKISVDDEWKEDVRSELRKREWTQADLAEKISVTPATITGLLKPGRSQSRVVARIHKVFGWIDPTSQAVASARTGVHRRIERGIASLSERDLETIAALVESLATKR
jgi:transcriptional regulator with XRE-family HTH domain